MTDDSRAFPKQLPVLLAAALLSGCALFKGSFQVDPCLVAHHDSDGATQTVSRRLGGTRYVAPMVEDDLILTYGVCRVPPTDPGGLNNTCDFPEAPSKALRAAVLERVIKRCDEICENHKNGFVSQSVMDKLFFGLSGIGLSAAGGLASGGMANVLSAAATATQGADKTVSKEVYTDHVVHSISAVIAADQAKKLQLIREHESDSDVDEYPIWAGLRDIQKYHDSCSFSTGLALLQEEASNSKKQAEEEKDNSEKERMSNFTKDAPGDLLRAFWKPDGKTVDAANAARLKQWMADNKVDSSITFFLRSEEFQEQRKKAVKDLDLKVKES